MRRSTSHWNSCGAATPRSRSRRSGAGICCACGARSRRWPRASRTGRSSRRRRVPAAPPYALARGDPGAPLRSRGLLLSATPRDVLQREVRLLLRECSQLLDPLVEADWVRRLVRVRACRRADQVGQPVNLVQEPLVLGGRLRARLDHLQKYLFHVRSVVVCLPEKYGERWLDVSQQVRLQPFERQILVPGKQPVPRRIDEPVQVEIVDAP